MCIRASAGSVLLTEPLELAENGRLMLTEEEGLNFVGGFSTLAQFLQEQKKDRHTEEVEDVYKRKPLLLSALSYCKSTPKISTWSKKGGPHNEHLELVITLSDYF